MSRDQSGPQTVDVGNAYTIFPKFEKGVPKLWFGRFGRLVSIEKDGRLAPRPAPLVPPPIDVRGLSRSLNFKPGFGRREGGGRMDCVGAKEGGNRGSFSVVFCKVLVAESTGRALRFAIWR